MNKIVREHYPVERLPEDLQEGLDLGSARTVRLVIEADMSDEELLAELDRKLDEGIADLDAGRKHSIDDVRAELAARFGWQTAE